MLTVGDILDALAHKNRAALVYVLLDGEVGDAEKVMFTGDGNVSIECGVLDDEDAEDEETDED